MITSLVTLIIGLAVGFILGYIYFSDQLTKAQRIYLESINKINAKYESYVNSNQMKQTPKLVTSSKVLDFKSRTPKKGSSLDEDKNN